MIWKRKGRYRFEVYLDKKGEWRWRLVAPNNRIIANSGEGYKWKVDCLDAIKLIKKHARCAEIKEVGHEHNDK